MTKIVWDKIGDRSYEGGVDRGVLYFPDGGGVPWNGLTSVSSDTPSDVEDIYYDGVKINQVVTVGAYEGSLKAYTYPDEFLYFEGLLETADGVFLTAQGQRPFHLSYRTMAGNDTAGGSAGYKIHVLWNLLAVPSDKEYTSLSLDSTAMEFEWKLTAIPEDVDEARPTAYLIIDSRDIPSAKLTAVENLLYGTPSTSPSLPSLKTLVAQYAS